MHGRHLTRNAGPKRRPERPLRTSPSWRRRWPRSVQLLLRPPSRPVVVILLARDAAPLYSRYMRAPRRVQPYPTHALVPIHTSPPLPAISPPPAPPCARPFPFFSLTLCVYNDPLAPRLAPLLRRCAPIPPTPRKPHPLHHTDVAPRLVTHNLGISPPLFRAQTYYGCVASSELLCASSPTPPFVRPLPFPVAISVSPGPGRALPTYPVPCVLQGQAFTRRYPPRRGLFALLRHAPISEGGLAFSSRSEIPALARPPRGL